jgi:hypothetical protein
MTDRPILFSAPMIQALLSGSKTQTRRLAWRCPCKPGAPKHVCGAGGYAGWKQSAACRIQPDDRLWVREAWIASSAHDQLPPREIPVGSRVGHCADKLAGHVLSGRYRAAFHMPRWASRLTLTVTEVRREPLQDITEADAIAEGIVRQNVIVDSHGHTGRHVEVTANRHFYDGCPDEGFEHASDAYASLWDQINGPGSWDANPEVVAITFHVERRNIDAVTS